MRTGHIASQARQLVHAVPDCQAGRGRHLPHKLGQQIRFLLGQDQGKPSINHALAHGAEVDARSEVYVPPSSMFQGSSAS